MAAAVLVGARLLAQMSDPETSPTVGEREQPALPTFYAIPLILLAMLGVFWWWRRRRPGTPDFHDYPGSKRP